MWRFRLAKYNMNWNKYEEDFREIALKSGKTRKYIEEMLEYAKHLFDYGLPIIYTQKHLCRLLGYKEEYVYAVSNSTSHFYLTYKITKKDGGYRVISEPMPSLKEIQRWILDNILVYVPISVYAKAYVKKRSIKENARFHKNQKVLLSLDVEGFFDNISSARVYSLFLNFGYNKDVAVILTNLCCLNGCLPQGGPASPAISNLILKEFDEQVGQFSRSNNIRYTRYADDLSFSGDFNPGQVICYVKKELFKLGLKLNSKKTRTRHPGQRQEVTGIVVNEKLQLPRDVRRKIRQEIYYIRKYGFQSHMEYCGITKKNYLLHLKGKIEHALFINRKDAEMQEYLKFLNGIGREFQERIEIN